MMTGTGPYGPLEMGGMFTTFKGAPTSRRATTATPATTPSPQAPRPTNGKAPPPTPHAPRVPTRPARCPAQPPPASPLPAATSTEPEHAMKTIKLIAACALFMGATASFGHENMPMLPNRPRSRNKRMGHCRRRQGRDPHHHPAHGRRHALCPATSKCARAKPCACGPRTRAR